MKKMMGTRPQCVSFQWEIQDSSYKMQLKVVKGQVSLWLFEKNYLKLYTHLI